MERKVRKKAKDMRTLCDFIGDPIERYLPYLKRGFGNQNYVSNRETYIGIEVEVEHVAKPDFYALLKPAIWNPHNDGSLRDNGMEYVTLPFSAEYLRPVMSSILQELKAMGAKFTQRCSIHLHLDVSKLLPFQFIGLFKCYLIFEEVLFNLVAGNRRDSNFCVPLSEVEFEKWFQDQDTWGGILEKLPDINAGKYSACNLAKLTQLGTMEFRHMPGTWSLDLIDIFVGSINNMKQFMLRQKSSEVLDDLIVRANTESNYLEICNTILGKYTQFLFPGGNYSDIENGITTAKRLMIDRSNVKREATLRHVISNPKLLNIVSKVMKDLPDNKEHDVIIDEPVRPKKPRLGINPFEVAAPYLPEYEAVMENGRMVGVRAIRNEGNNA